MKKGYSIRNRIKSEGQKDEFVPDQTFVLALRQKIEKKIEELKSTKHKNVFSTKIKEIFSKFPSQKEIAYLQLALGIIIVFILSYIVAFPILKNSQTINYDILSELIEVEPDKSTKDGIYPETKFKILANKEIPIEILKQRLTLKPETEFEIKKINSKEYELTPLKTLENNLIYQIQINNSKPTENNNYSWAFQVKDKFRIINTVPSNKSTNVPKDISIKINLSNNNFAENFADYIEIDPKIEGSFQRKDKSIIFIPKENLNSNQVYSVKIKKDLYNIINNETLGSDYIFAFETGGEEIKEPELYLDKINYNFTPNVIPYFELYGSEDLTNKQLITEVYKLTPEVYEKIIKNLSKTQNTLWANYNRHIIYNRSELQKINSITLTVSNSNNIKVTLPNKLENGLYLIDFGFKPNKPKRSALVNITYLSSYINISNNKTLFWLNNLNDGNPVNNAKVYVNNEFVGSTNENGLLEVKTLQNLNSDSIIYTKIEKDNKTEFFISEPWYDNFSTYYFYGKSDNNYWSYLYTDRTVYQQNDEINVWGYIKLKNHNDKLKNSKYLEIKNVSSDIPIRKYGISLNEFGFFQKTISDISIPGNYYIIIKDENNAEIVSRFIQVQDYTKPVYMIDFTTDKSAVTEGELINIKGNVKFYSGEPVQGLEVKIQAFNKEYTVETNEAGDFELNNITAILNNSSLPKYIYHGYYSHIENIKVVDNEINSGYAISTKQVKVLPKYGFEAQKIDTNKAIVKGYLLEPSKKNYNFFDYDDEYKTQPASNIEVNVILEEIINKIIELPDTYDPTYGGKQKNYDFVTEKKEINFNTLKTNQNGEFTILYNFKDEAFYNILISYNTNLGETILSTNLLGIRVHNNNPEINYVFLEKESTKERYDLNEKETFTVRSNFNLGDQTKYLFIKYQNGIIEFNLSKDPKIELTMKEEYLPNIYIESVVFDGKNVMETGLYNFKYNHDLKKAEITLKTDKEKYQPGENVELNIETKYQNKPIPMNINISVVDESYFALFNDNTDISEIYTDIIPGKKFTFSSHTLKTEINGGLGGQLGGDLKPRSDFKDTALFISTKTDDDGKKKLSFKLPDNITSWRITYQGISDSTIPEYFKSYVNIKSTKPFFIQVTGANKFIIHDKPTLRIRAVSRNINNADVDYEIKSDSLNLNKTLKGKINKFIEINLNELTLGSHEIKIEAKGPDNLMDSIIYKIKVEQTNLIKYKTNVENLSNSTKLNVSDKTLFVELIFDDLTRSNLHRNLIDIFFAKDIRLDNIIASQIAAFLLNKYFDNNIELSNIDLAAFYKANEKEEYYYYSLLPYGTEDIELNVNLLEVFKAGNYNIILHNQDIKQYLTTKLNQTDDKNQKAIIYYGLTLLDEKLLNEVQNLLNEENINEISKIYLTLALIEYGDTRKALQISNEYFSFDKPIQLDNPRSMLLLSRVFSKLNKIQESLNLYNKAKDKLDATTNLLEALYMDSVLPKLSKISGSFEYQIGNENSNKVELSQNANLLIQLTPDQARKINFKEVNGNIGLIIKETIQNEDIGTTNSKNIINVSKKYFVDDKETYVIKSSDTIRVELTFNNIKNLNQNNTCLYLIENIPSGLKSVPSELLESKQIQNNKYIFIQEGNNKYKICVNTIHTSSKYTYYLRPSSKGIFKIEPSILYDENGNIISISQNTNKIEIK